MWKLFNNIRGVDSRYFKEILLDTYVLQQDMRIRLPKQILNNLNVIKGETMFTMWKLFNNIRGVDSRYFTTIGIYSMYGIWIIGLLWNDCTYRKRLQ